MKLYYSKTSPYSRKVRLLLYEAGLASTVAMLPCNPFEENPELIAANPLSKIPTLITGDQTALYDSPVICEYLDTLHPTARLIPPVGEARWSVLRWQALCDGMLDASYNIVMERRRPANERSTTWIAQWETQILRALQYCEENLGTLPAPLSLAQLALGATLGYLDFRLAELDWRTHCPALNDWFEDFSLRESMLKTKPDDA